MTRLFAPGEWWRDVRHAARVLRRTPAHTAAVTLLVALGVGATCAIFALANALFLRELPVHRPGELVQLRRMARGTSQGLSIPLFEEFRGRLTSAECVVGVGDVQNASMASNNRRSDPFEIDGVIVSGNYFRCLGIGTALGRPLTDDDDRLQAPNAVIVLSHAAWVRHFGGDPAVIAASVSIAGSRFTVVGVTPRALRGLAGDRGVGGDFWVPLSMQPVVQPGGDRRRNPASSNLRVMARLTEGAAIGRTASEVAIVYGQTPEPIARPGSSMEVTPANRGFAGALGREYAMPLRVLSATSVLLLLITCANVAGLLLIRSGASQRETAVRQALGSGRGRLIRQCFVESVLVAVLGGAVGLGVAMAAIRALLAFIPPALAAAVDPSLDRNLLVFFVAVSGVTAMLSGAWPAVRASRGGLDAILRSTSSAVTPSRSRRSWNHGLVAAQTALAVVLVAASTQFGMSLYRLYTLDPGFDRNRVIVATVDGRPAGYQDAKQQADLARRLVERFRAMPGVRSASVAATGVLSGNRRGTASYAINGRQFTEERTPLLLFNEVSINYLELLGVQIVAGRGFTRDDRAGGPRVAVVNEAFARYYFSESSPVGARLDLADPADRQNIEIVGVARDTKLRDVREATLPLVFLPFEQFPARFNDLLIRVDGSSEAFLGAIRAAALAVEPKVRIDRLRTLDDALLGTLSRDVLMTRLSGLLASISLALVFCGVYTVIAFLVAARTREIGIRLAFGAEPGRIRREVVLDAWRPVAAGTAAGLLIAVLSTRFIEAMLFDARAVDPVTLGSAAAALFVISTLGAFIPAWRASLVDPVRALRSE